MNFRKRIKKYLECMKYIKSILVKMDKILEEQERNECEEKEAIFLIKKQLDQLDAKIANLDEKIDSIKKLMEQVQEEDEPKDSATYAMKLFMQIMFLFGVGISLYFVTIEWGKISLVTYPLFYVLLIISFYAIFGMEAIITLKIFKNILYLIVNKEIKCNKVVNTIISKVLNAIILVITLLLFILYVWIYVSTLGQNASPSYFANGILCIAMSVLLQYATDAIMKVGKTWTFNYFAIIISIISLLLTVYSLTS